MLRLIIVLHVVESIEFVEDKNLLIHRTLGADRTAYSLSIRINGDSSQLSFFVFTFRERLIVLRRFLNVPFLEVTLVIIQRHNVDA